MAINYVRELALFYPSRALIYILTKLVSQFKDKQLAVLKTTIVRSLNIILVRTPKDKLIKIFQIQFPTFIKEHLIQHHLSIFANVPEEMANELKTTFEKYQIRKKM
jgi:hypothetical protein